MHLAACALCALSFVVGHACLSTVAHAETPSILWRFNTLDASFGQSAAADLDRDGRLEVAFGCYRRDSSIYVLNAEDGSLLWRFNARGRSSEGCNDAAPLLADVDADGDIEVIVAGSCNPTTWCFNGSTGAIEWATPSRGSDSPPTLADIDGDGRQEILHGEFGGYVICLNGEDGSVAWELAVDTNAWIQTAPTIFDADGDGVLDFVVATWNSAQSDTNSIRVYRGSDRRLLWRRPLADVVYHGTSIADLDQDGRPELALGDYSGMLSVFNGEDGSIAWRRTSHGTGHYIGAPVSAGDLDGDGTCELIAISWYLVLALRADGSEMWRYEIPGYATAFRGAVLADVSGDANRDVVFGTSDGKVIALDGLSGALLWSIDLAADYGDPRFALDHAPIIADLNNDMQLDLFIVGGYARYPDMSANFGRAYALSIGSGAGPSWTSFQANTRRTSSTCDVTVGTPVVPEVRELDLADN